MNPIENCYVMVLEVMQRENVQTFSHFKTAFIWTGLVGKLLQNVSFVNHESVNKLHTSVNVNPLFSALINGS